MNARKVFPSRGEDTCAGKGFVTPNKHDELPHSFCSTMDNNNYRQCVLLIPFLFMYDIDRDMNLQRNNYNNLFFYRCTLSCQESRYVRQ